MAKRKTARPDSRRRTPGASGGRARPAKRPSSRAGAARTPPSPTTAGKAARRKKPSPTPGRTARPKVTARPRGAAPKRSAERPVGKAATARSTGPGRKTLTRRANAGPGRQAAGAARTSGPGTPPSTGPHATGTLRPQTRADRDRRYIEEAVPTPPSSLDLDRRPSAARSGRAQMEEALSEHTATGPALTGGDVDADWQSAYNTGDEAPGGDMPTPDQAIVQDIGTAMGVEYNDDEELKGAEKIEERDRHRWELDPASAEDYRERASVKVNRRGRGR